MGSHAAKLNRLRARSLKNRWVFCPRSGAWVRYKDTVIEADSGYRVKKGYEDKPGFSIMAIDKLMAEKKPMVHVEVSTKEPTSFDMSADEITVWGL